jgi:3-oxoacyl-[acyl-carrier-protein] synthase III
MGADIARFRLQGAGKALPERRLGNEELAKILGTDAASIKKRTGIDERRIANRNEFTSVLGAAAARMALEHAGITADQVDLIVLSTYTPDHLLCPTAPALAYEIGATAAGAFDINGACTGGVSALLTGCSLLGTGAFRRILVVSSDVTTRYIRADDPKTRLVFGDGASALLLENPVVDVAPWRVLAADVGADGSGAVSFRVPAGGAAFPPQLNGFRHDAVPSIEMDGRAIYRFGVDRGLRVIETLCEKASLDLDQVTWVIPHQANQRMIDSMIDRSHIPAERWVINLDRYGNTAGCSVPLALAELHEENKIRPGDVILLAAFGAGLTWSGLAIEAGG